MKTNFLNFKKEKEIIKRQFNYVAGCDEVGVGPLAGPVVAAACIIRQENFAGRCTKNKWHARVRDSKKISQTEREALDVLIRANCLAFGIGEVSPQIVDKINIHNASLLAMQIAFEKMIESLHVEQLGSELGKKIFLLVDGRFTIKNLQACNGAYLQNGVFIEQEAVVDGDAKILSIAAASIIAKVHRDALMKQFHKSFPLYNFGQHKGYATREHYAAIAAHGITNIHRKSFLLGVKFIAG